MLYKEPFFSLSNSRIVFIDWWRRVFPPLLLQPLSPWPPSFSSSLLFLLAFLLSTPFLPCPFRRIRPFPPHRPPSHLPHQLKLPLPDPLAPFISSPLLSLPLIRPSPWSPSLFLFFTSILPAWPLVLFSHLGSHPPPGPFPLCLAPALLLLLLPSLPPRPLLSRRPYPHSLAPSSSPRPPPSFHPPSFLPPTHAPSLPRVLEDSLEHIIGDLVSGCLPREEDKEEK